MKMLAAMLGSILAMAGVLHEAWPVDEPLPEVARPCVVDIFPDFDLRAMEIGGYEAGAFEHFGSRIERPLLEDSLHPRRCVAFVYDEELVSSPLGVTVLIDGGRIRERWLTKEPFPASCDGLAHETVALKGYAHARVCFGS